MKTFSKEWTDKERLKIVLLLSKQIQADIPNGRYGAQIAPFQHRPNMQSIINVITASKEELEANRASLEKIACDHLRATHIDL